ncbi:dipeptidase [Amycolatopsis balhimycina DSM 5908]|uniref:Dipeptidase n=1 Tax=Amycolatopsis balhimycina DSM 5908 TaxID=1081091 RepID=A0A428X6H1_AMYBA|nr:dipeptidase [Amycolatopsis balhimycina]RSM50922.1 dipeptidase [Amycolatopsis balhimycina DSM 5908]
MDLRSRVEELMPRARDELADLVALRSVADPRQFPPEECHRAAIWVADAFTEAGFATDLADTPDGSQAVVGSRPCGREGAPTVLLYAHYDVQPPLADDEWRTPPFRLTEVDGRWYGRGAADCKGNILMHLTALRALGDDVPVDLKLVVEGSEEQGTGGLEAFVPEHAELLRADAILVGDTGNVAVGYPAVTVSLRGMVNVVVHVEALPSELHSGMFGGPAPDALAALVTVLATLRDDDGDTTVHGLPGDGRWSGAPYPAAQFRADAGLSPGTVLLGSGEVADTLWARPAVTVLGIDCPPVVGSTAALVPRARARLNLRIPPGVDPYHAACALSEHLMAAAPWGVDVSVETEAIGEPFRAATGGPAHQAMGQAMETAYGRPASQLGQGGSIPLCTVLAETYPDAEILLIGVEEPQARIHAPNESVAPREIAHMALAEALFLRDYGTGSG